MSPGHALGPVVAVLRLLEEKIQGLPRKVLCRMGTGSGRIVRLRRAGRGRGERASSVGGAPWA
jgi:hypothetical protein